MHITPFKTEIDDVKDGLFQHAELVTVRKASAKRNFPLRVRIALLGLAGADSYEKEYVIFTRCFITGNWP